MKKDLESYIIKDSCMVDYPRIQYFPELAPKELLEIELPERADYSGYFDYLTSRRITTGVALYNGVVRDCFGVGPWITGGGVNHLWYYAAKEKGYGLDTEDVLEDSERLLSRSDGLEDLKLQELHRNIPGWDLMMVEFPDLVGAIRRHHEWDPEIADPYKGDDAFLPFWRWRIYPDGTRKWLFDLNGGNIKNSLVEHLGLKSGEEKLLSPLLGLTYVATMAQEIVGVNPRMINKEGKAYLGRGVDVQINGVLQAPLMSILRGKQFLDSSFIIASEDYIDQSLK